MKGSNVEKYDHAQGIRDSTIIAKLEHFAVDSNINKHPNRQKMWKLLPKIKKLLKEES